ncbi:MAG: hypothetical protein SFY66_10770 [Oculatellaceae cyanobacterium bins.114]|nr:hypothetical protein [Oculatellaceae cyanobacterium bins.114]
MILKSFRKWLMEHDPTLKPAQVSPNLLTSLSGSDRDYITTQIQRLNSGKYDADDCLYRIASCADLIKGDEQITDNNRDRILQWIRSFQSDAA